MSSQLQVQLGDVGRVDHNLSADVACQDRGPLFPGSSCFPLSPDHKHKPLGCKSSGNNAVEFKTDFSLVCHVFSLIGMCRPVY